MLYLKKSRSDESFQDLLSLSLVPVVALLICLDKKHYFYWLLSRGQKVYYFFARINFVLKRIFPIQVLDFMCDIYIMFCSNLVRLNVAVILHLVYFRGCPMRSS